LQLFVNKQSTFEIIHVCVNRSSSTTTFVQKRTADRWICEGKWGERGGGESLSCISKPRSMYVGASSS